MSFFDRVPFQPFIPDVRGIRCLSLNPRPFASKFCPGSGLISRCAPFWASGHVRECFLVPLLPAACFLLSGSDLSFLSLPCGADRPCPYYNDGPGGSSGDYHPACALALRAPFPSYIVYLRFFSFLNFMALSFQGCPSGLFLLSSFLR